MMTLLLGKTFNSVSRNHNCH